MTALVPQFTVPDEHFAVVLNANAGRVTRRLARSVARVIPEERIFLTHSPEHARKVLEECVQERIGTVFAGGGDGTIVDVINTLHELRQDGAHVPSIGVLRLGTGNALAHWLGAGRPARDLARWQGGMVHRQVPVHMVEAENTLFPFAGLGHDAAVLNDYEWLMRRARGQWWQGLAKGLPGYFMAGYLKTVPNYLRRNATQVEVVNIGRPAFRIGPDGREIGPPIPAGGLLYRGPASLLGAATTPLYGYGMRMFPHATARAGRFQLRVLNMTALQSVAHFAACWRGTLRHPGLHDFWADRVRVMSQDAMPYQLGGEAKGYRNEITFALTRYPVNLVGQA